VEDGLCLLGHKPSGYDSQSGAGFVMLRKHAVDQRESLLDTNQLKVNGSSWNRGPKCCVTK